MKWQTTTSSLRAGNNQLEQIILSISIVIILGVVVLYFSKLLSWQHCVLIAFVFIVLVNEICRNLSKRLFLKRVGDLRYASTIKNVSLDYPEIKARLIDGNFKVTGEVYRNYSKSITIIGTTFVVLGLLIILIEFDIGRILCFCGIIAILFGYFEIHNVQKSLTPKDITIKEHTLPIYEEVLEDGLYVIENHWGLQHASAFVVGGTLYTCFHSTGGQPLIYDNHIILHSQADILLDWITYCGVWNINFVDEYNSAQLIYPHGRDICYKTSSVGKLQIDGISATHSV
jgi:hypothetical protein